MASLARITPATGRMHPERRAWAQIASEDDESFTGSSSSETSSDEESDEEPLAKTRTKRSNELVCAAAKTIKPNVPLTEPFQSMMNESFNNVVLSDITIFIRGLRFPAHSFVLAAQCNYFRDALTKGGLKNEAVREFYLDKGPPHAYWRMLEYLYKGTYSVEPAPEIRETDDQPNHRHIHVYGVAEAFEIEGLKQLATGRFKECMKQAQLNKNFVECIRLIYKTGPKQSMLKKEVMDIVGRHSKALWKIGAFQHLINCGGNFAVDFVTKILGDK